VDFALIIEILAQNHSIFRDAEISPQQNFALVFLFIFVCQKHEKRRPGGTGKVVKADFESHPQISCTKI